MPRHMVGANDVVHVAHDADKRNPSAFSRRSKKLLRGSHLRPAFHAWRMAALCNEVEACPLAASAAVPVPLVACAAKDAGSKHGFSLSDKVALDPNVRTIAATVEDSSSKKIPVLLACTVSFDDGADHEGSGATTSIDRICSIPALTPLVADVGVELHGPNVLQSSPNFHPPAFGAEAQTTKMDDNEAICVASSDLVPLVADVGPVREGNISKRKIEKTKKKASTNQHTDALHRKVSEYESTIRELRDCCSLSSVSKAYPHDTVPGVRDTYDFAPDSRYLSIIPEVGSFHDAVNKFIGQASPTLRSEDFDCNGFGVLTKEFGTYVLLFGFKARPELNGRVGLLGQHVKQGRWAVQVFTPEGLHHMLMRGDAEKPVLFEPQLSLSETCLASIELEQPRWAFASVHNVHG